MFIDFDKCFPIWKYIQKIVKYFMDFTNVQNNVRVYENVHVLRKCSVIFEKNAREFENFLWLLGKWLDIGKMFTNFKTILENLKNVQDCFSN